MHQDHDSGHEETGESGSPWLDRVNDAYYNRLGDRMGRRTRDRINWMCAACDGGSVLDIGCSQGITSLLLGREGFRVLGIDLMQEAVDHARRELAAEPSEVQARVRFERMDLMSMEVGTLYDNVIVGEVVEHQTNAVRFLRSAMRHLAPGGRMVVTVPFGLHPFPDHKCTVFPRNLVEALGDELRIASMDVSDGYVRMVATREPRGNKTGSDAREAIAEVTEAGTIEAQAQYFELMEGSRRAEAKRRALGEQVKELQARNRKLERAGEQVQASLREELMQLKSQLLLLRNESIGASREADELRARLAADARDTQALRKSATAAAAERDERARQLATLQSESEDQRKQLRQLRAAREALTRKVDLATAVEQDRAAQALKASQALRDASARERQLKRKIEQMADYRRRLEHQHKTTKSWLDDANAELRFLHESVSLRLGMTLVSAFRSPRDFLAMPVRLGRLFASGLRRRYSRRLAPSASAGDAKEADPGGLVTAPRGPQARNARKRGNGDLAAEAVLPVSGLRPIPLPAASRNTVLPLVDEVHPVATPREPFPALARDVRIAAIMDDFTREAFRHTCRLQQLSPEGWQAEMEAFRPHLVMVESAWRGEGDRWVQKIYPLSRELAEMVAWARAQGIPTIFWNKEDPVHFSVFLATARLFDHVFTTDIDCIKSYRAELGHDRVHLLPFACEPRTHNPVETRARADAFCFAGSYYAKYPERQRDFASLVDALRDLRPVDIFDRNHGKDEPSLAFPEVYRPLIRGNLPYDQIDRAYKGYRYGININTVKQSQSMFARRAFDLLASNTVTVSNFSRGLRLLFGELVISTDSGGEAAHRLAPLLADDAAYRRFRLQGLRKVMAEHTYEDRLGFVLGKVSGHQRAQALPSIVVLATAGNAAELARLLAAYDRQSYARRRLVVVADPAIGLPVDARDDVQVLAPVEAQGNIATCFEGHWIACFDPGDYYGRNYLTDLVLATRYSDASAFGKAAHHAADANGVARLVGHGGQYTSSELRLRACIADAGVFAGKPVMALAEAIASDPAPVPGLALDEFNYCRDWQGHACDMVDDPALHAGIDMAHLQQMASMGGEEEAGVSEGTLRGFGPDELATLFTPGFYADGRVEVSRQDGGIELASSLGEGKHAYVYASELLDVDVLFPGPIGRFNMLVSAETLVSVTLIFLDEQQRRVGYVIRACNSNQSVVPAEGTRYVKLGMRVQAAGLATMRRLVLEHVPPEINALAGTGRHLVVSRGYPGYDNLYSYSFVHRRLLGYRQAGLKVDVFRLTGTPLAYEEFEGVDITSGNTSDLALMLQSNGYETILVHSFDEQVWSAIRPLLDRARVIVWVHGAEIQPWYRRDFNNAGEADRKTAIQRSDMRMALWRSVLGDMPANLHLVFVSEFLARQAMRDLGITIPRDRYSVIHNLTDGDFFRYREKSADMRHHVLSIRPYSKRTYANDLAVKAILDLSREPWFGDMRFSLYGDGVLFEETVAPLREGFPNVYIGKRFLRQDEIRRLHGEHGIFLVPSRIDSQGVSRDEAMASGLVPVTNRVSAIPEFVDGDVAMLAGAEDWRGLADAIRTLHDDPGLFMRMSCAAAAHVRSKSGAAATISREIAMIKEGAAVQEAAGDRPPVPRRIAVYGDLNLNLIDGSAVWAASLVEVLAGLPDVEVDLYLKARLTSTRVVGAVLDLPNVRIIEPEGAHGLAVYECDEAIARIADQHALNAYDAIVLRGYALCRVAAREPRLHGVLWTYLTDIPQKAELLDAGWREGLGEIAGAARFMLCQTAALQSLLEDAIPATRGKTRRLPPMVPGQPAAANALREVDGVLRIAYAGKFAPLWGIREMFRAVADLNSSGIQCELHVFGDKIHNPADDPGFRDEVRKSLQESPGVVWHGGVSRATLLAELPKMDLGWAWRHPDLETGTLELSTKVLEYGLCGLPVLMMGSPANTAAFGPDYPLYAETPEAIARLLARVADHRELLDDAATRSREIAADHTYAAIREQWVRPLLPPRGTTEEGVAACCPA